MVLKQKSYAKVKSMEWGLEEGSEKLESGETLEMVAEKFAQIIILAFKNNKSLNFLNV